MADFRDPRDVNSTIWQRFSRHHETAQHSPRTIQSYCEAAEQLADHAGGADLTKLTRTDIEDYLMKVRKLHSASTVRRMPRQTVHRQMTGSTP